MNREDMLNLDREGLEKFLSSNPNIMPLDQALDIRLGTLDEESLKRYENHEYMNSDWFQDVDLTPSWVESNEDYEEIRDNQPISSGTIDKQFEPQAIINEDGKAEVIPIYYDREAKEYITLNELAERIAEQCHHEWTVTEVESEMWDSNFEKLFSR